MNILITNDKYISNLRLQIKPFLLIALSVLFIPAGYVFILMVFIADLLSYKIITKYIRTSILVFSYILLGLVFSNYKLVSLLYATIYFLCLYSFLYSFENFDRSFKYKDFITKVSLFVFIIGLLQYFSPYFSIPSKWVDLSNYSINKRIYSTFFNPNVFGFYINFILLSICGSETSNFNKLTLLTGIACLVLTFSRASWVSLILALLVTGFIEKKYFKYALYISIIIFLSDYLLGVGRLNLNKAVEDSSFAYRLEIWRATLLIIRDNFLSGIGFGTLKEYVTLYSTVVKNNIEHTHNIYLQVFLETGLVGFVLFSVFIKNIVNKLYNKVIEDKDREWLRAFSIFIMSMTHGVVDSVVLTPQITMLMSIYIGFLLKSEVQSSQSRNLKASLH